METKGIAYVLLLLGIIAKTTLTKSITSTCEVPIASKELWHYMWPLVFKPNGELYPATVDDDGTNPSGDHYKVVVENGAEVLLSCGPNYIKKFNRQEVVRVKCNGASGNFSVTSEVKGVEPLLELNIKDFACDLRVIEEVLHPVDGCNNDKWTSTKFGFVHPIEKVTFIVGEACYDANAGRTIFAHVQIFGGDSASYLRKIDKTFLAAHLHPDSSYKIEMFRGLHFDELYDSIRQQLHVKHAPSLKMTHFIDETLLGNAQLRAVKKLGWNYYLAHDDQQTLDAAKQDIRSLSDRLQGIDVYVGAQGVHSIHGPAGEKLDIYLQPSRFPMPQMVWILVRYKQKALAIVVANDESNAGDIHHLCPSVCEKVTWLKKAAVPNRGMVCCSYESLKNAIKEVPTLDDVNELLI